MKSQTIQLNNLDSVAYISNQARRILNGCVKDKKQRIECVFRNAISAKERRSIAQNSLNWLWCREIAKATGETSDEVHKEHKLKYGIPIMCRDKDFMLVWQPYRYADPRLKRKIMDYMQVTSLMNTEQMAEYLTTIQDDYGRSGLRLTEPDDLFNEAMGRK